MNDSEKIRLRNVGTETVASFSAPPPEKREMPDELLTYFEVDEPSTEPESAIESFLLYVQPAIHLLVSLPKLLKRKFLKL